MQAEGPTAVSSVLGHRPAVEGVIDLLHLLADDPLGGDVEGARILAKAARHWRARGGGSVWTYTHYGRAPIFTGDLVADRALLARVVERMVVHAIGEVVLHFREADLFGPMKSVTMDEPVLDDTTRRLTASWVGWSGAT